MPQNPTNPPERKRSETDALSDWIASKKPRKSKTVSELPQLGMRWSWRFWSPFAAALVAALWGKPVAAQAGEATYQAHDSLPPLRDSDPQVQAALDRLVYMPEPFTVQGWASSAQRLGPDAELRFASPHGLDDESTDETLPRDDVVLWWFAARGEDRQVVRAPAVVIAHSMHPQTLVANMMASGLAARGIHGFVVKMPGFAPRERVKVKTINGQSPPRRRLLPAVDALVANRATIRELRRARDAVAVLPKVQEHRIGLVGVSLGAFAGSVAAAMDGAYDPVVLLLGGADGVEVLETGVLDARTLREDFFRLGYQRQNLEALLNDVAPFRVASRLDPQRTWLISGRDDLIVRADNARQLAQRIGLDEEHHLWLNANHYTAALFLPSAVELIARIMDEMPLVREQADAHSESAEDE